MPRLNGLQVVIIGGSKLLAPPEAASSSESAWSSVRSLVEMSKPVSFAIATTVLESVAALIFSSKLVSLWTFAINALSCSSDMFEERLVTLLHESRGISK